MKFNDLVFGNLYDGKQSVVSYGDYELSIISHSYSYGGKQGLYEIGVFHHGEQTELKGVTEDGDTIKGFLREEDVNAIMMKMVSLTTQEGVQV